MRDTINKALGKRFKWLTVGFFEVLAYDPDEAEVTVNLNGEKVKWPAQLLVTLINTGPVEETTGPAAGWPHVFGARSGQWHAPHAIQKRKPHHDKHD